MNLNKDLEFIDLGLFIKAEKTLILGDFHIGSDQALSESGALSPNIGISEIKDSIKNIILKTKPETIILLGDIKVNFGNFSKGEKLELLSFLKVIKDSCKKLILIKGNHDNYIKEIVKEIDLEFQESFETNNYFFTHGDKVFKTNKVTIIGHEHPAIVISNNIRSEKYKCFLITKKLIILPSINKTTIGNNILNKDFISPYITNKIIKEANIYIVHEKKVLYFGKLSDLE